MNVYTCSIFFYFVLRNKGALCDVNCEMDTRLGQEPCLNYSSLLQQSSEETAVISTERWCSKWCQENQTISWYYIDYFDGHIMFTLVPAPSLCNHTEYGIKLISTVDNSSLNSFCKFNSSEDCMWELKGVFEGSYYLSVKPHGIGVKCISSVFNITGFVYSAHPMYKAQREILDVIVSFNNIPVSNMDTGYVPEKFTAYLKSDMEKEDEHCKNNGRKTSCCEVGSDEDDCTLYPKNCTCVRTESNIQCTFQNVTPGNYCFEIYDKDRCHHDLNCYWVKLLVLNQSKTDTDVPMTFSDYTTLVIIGIILLFLFVLIGILIFCKQKHSEHVKSFLPLIQMPKTVSEGGKLKVLLAYPRDCPLFMKTMTEFRKVLKEIIHAEVYDTWDSEIWELVAEKHDTWAVNYCYDNNVKVILMATYCSRFIQDALISGQDIEYTDPQPFDKSFLVILKCLMQMTEQTYKRIFVVRLDGVDYERNTFKYINPFTVYTIPQQLHKLECDLQNLNHLETDSPYTVDSLSSVIDRFKQYQIDNPYYFKHMINVKVKEE